MSTSKEKTTTDDQAAPKVRGPRRGWTDRHGRPELLMHPDIVSGRATVRILDEPQASPTK